MEQLRRYAIFAAVVEAGSMTGAAKSLGMTPPPSVSISVSWRACSDCPCSIAPPVVSV